MTASNFSRLPRWAMSAALGVAVVGLAGWAQPALAQSDAPRAKKPTETITVSATRRGETDIQTTPVAVTAISSDTIDLAVPQNIGDLSYFVPNFSAAKMAAFNAASFAMRGIGQTDIIIYLDAPVGVVVDDFVMPSVQTQLLDTFDVERVEVLRGPQGTLFGKNTTAGALLVQTKKPELDEFGVQGQVRAGNYGTIGLRAAANVPLVEGKLAMRVNFLYDQSDGYYHLGAQYGPITPFDADNPYDGATGQGDGRKFGGQDVWGGRVKVKFQPTDNFSALLQYEIMRDDSDAPPSINETPLNDPRFVWNLLGATQDVVKDPLDAAAATLRDDSLLNMSGGHQVDVDGVYLNMEWDLGDYTLYSVTGYRSQRSRLPSTYTGEVGPVSLFDANRADNRKTFQQELRIASELDGPLNFVAGAFYQSNDAKFCVTQVLGFLDLIGLIGAVPGGFDNNPQVLCNRQDAEAFALFTDVSYDVTSKFQISGGVRYTWEKKSWAGRHQILFQQLTGGFDPDFTWQSVDGPLDAVNFEKYPFGVVENSRSWDEPTWRITLSYELSDEFFTYATVSRGFRSGTYNDQTGTTGIPLFNDPDGVDATDPVNPEFATSYELGIKGDLFENQFAFALTGFYVTYGDAQRALVATLTNSLGETFQETRFFNAAKIEVKGLEFEATWRPIEGLVIRGNFSYQDGKYKKFQADTDFDGMIDIDFSGRPLTRAPKWMASINVAYTHPLGNIGSLTWNASYNYEDSNVYIYSDVDSDFDTFLDARNLLNASLTFEEAENRYFIRVYGKNLTDDRYRIASQPVANLWTHTQYGYPRQWGFEIGFDL